MSGKSLLPCPLGDVTHLQTIWDGHAWQIFISLHFEFKFYANPVFFCFKYVTAGQFIQLFLVPIQNCIESNVAE